MLSVSELRELSQKATPRPWVIDSGDDEYCSSISGIISVSEQARIAEISRNRPHRGDFPEETLWVTVSPGCAPAKISEDHTPYNDSEYIVAACNSLPSILDRLEAAEADAKYMRGRESFLERFVLDVYDIVNGEESDAEEKLESIRRRLDNNESDGLDDLRAALSPPKKGE
jgi:hypothetical protein